MNQVLATVGHQYCQGANPREGEAARRAIAKERQGEAGSSKGKAWRLVVKVLTPIDQCV